jgi:hypothetical protein
MDAIQMNLCKTVDLTPVLGFPASAGVDFKHMAFGSWDCDN